jgi:hypothetical protein
MSIFENLKKVLKKVVFLGGLDHNALVHRKSNFIFVMINFSIIFTKKLGVLFISKIRKKREKTLPKKTPIYTTTCY